MMKEKKLTRKLIDVSEHQGMIDWERVKPQIDGAILRCGYGGDYPEQDDAEFRRNADACTRLGIPFGVYLYSYADTLAKARSEASHVLRLIKGYQLSYPVYLDLEEPGKESGAIERAILFGDIIEQAGYWCGVYANLNWWENHLEGLDRFTKWVAQYYKVCEYEGSYLDIWQYTARGSVDGIDGFVDINECYRDLPAEIVGIQRKSVDTLAAEVIEGKWDNGDRRVEMLTEAGYDYDAVQNRVNEILLGGNG